MAVAKKKNRMTPPTTPANLEELANLADAWADMCDKHRWSGDARPFVSAAGQQLREKAATIRGLLLLKVAQSARQGL